MERVSLRHLCQSIMTVLLAAGLLTILITPLTALPALAAGTGQATGQSISQKVLRLESIEIQGIFKTRRSVITNLVGLRPGDPLDPEILMAVRSSLEESTYFSEIDLSTRPGSRRGQVILVLKLRERNLPYLETGFGFSDPWGWYFTPIGFRSENPFGAGGRIRGGLHLGFRNLGGDLEGLFPLRIKRQLALKLGVRVREVQSLWYEAEPGWMGLYDEYRLKIQRVETELGLVWRMGRSLSLGVGLVGDNCRPESHGNNRDSGAEVPLEDITAGFDISDRELNLAAYQLVFHLKGGGFNNRPGTSLLARGRLVSGGLGADRDYYRLTFALQTVRPTGGGTTLGGIIRGGATETAAPWYERFHIGGSYSVRGFRDHSLSPPTGHISYWTASAEFRFPMLHRRGKANRESLLSGLVFTDLGRGWLAPSEDDFPDIDYQRLNLGAGYGIRLHMPWLGTIGFDVGLPVTAGVTGEPVWYYLTLGHSF